jgi:hypothetical protein
MDTFKESDSTFLVFTFTKDGDFEFLMYHYDYHFSLFGADEKAASLYKLSYWSRCVSWSIAISTWFIATISRQLERLLSSVDKPVDVI